MQNISHYHKNPLICRIGHLALLLLFLSALFLMPGCRSLSGLAGWSSPTGQASIRSLDQGLLLKPSFSTIVFISQSENEADVYLTDLSLQDLTPGAPISNITGQIMHLHLFVVPKAGKTPIASEASTATLRHAIISQGRVGIYGGGGFFIPKNKPTGKKFAGSTRKSTLRLLSRSAGFADRLGASQASVSFTAQQNPELVRTIQARFDDLLAVATPIPSTQSKKTPPPAKAATDTPSSD